jgi:hypothetical protein
MPKDAAWKRNLIADAVWFLVWAVASSVWCITAAAQLGATFDEPVYILRGLEHWRTGSAGGLLRMGTMPLPADVDTLPLYLWERWHGVTLDPQQQWEQLLPWARGSTLVFWWLLLAYAWKTGRLFGGPWGGRLAVAFLACEPSLLAHASLATTDIAVTACVLALVYHFRTGRDRGWLRRVGVPALWFGAAVLAKASGLVFGVLALVVLELERLARQGAFTIPAIRSPWAFLRHAFVQTARLRRDLLQIVPLGLALVFLYCGSEWQPEPSFVAWAQSLPEGRARVSMLWLAEHLRIFSNAGEGIMRQVKHNMHGHGAYLLGRSSPRAFWYYFPVLLTIKLSPPLLLAPLVLLVLRPRTLLNGACLVAVVLIAFSITWRVQIGIRLVLPLVALAVVGLSVALAQAATAPGSTWQRRLPVVGVAAGIAWTAVAACLVWPNGLCYVNRFWGGTRTGYLLVSDANYDWGQGLPELARWEQQRSLASLDVWYFGSDPEIVRLPLRVVPFHQLPLHSLEEVRAQVDGHYLAVSTTLLYGSGDDAPGLVQARALLQTLRPAARTTTFLIYDFTHPPIPSLARRS